MVPRAMADATTFNAELEARDLAVARGGRLIVEGVNLKLGAGDAAILRGPNGAGKTTLLRALAGLLSPAAGAVTASDNSRIFCGVLNAAKPTQTVTETMRFWAALYGGALGPARAAFGLEPFENRPVRELSTGYQRRLGLSRLVLSGRPIWLVDEPTAGLDAGAATTFARLLAEHRDRGGAAVIASHEQIDAPGARLMELQQ